MAIENPVNEIRQHDLDPIFPLLRGEFRATLAPLGLANAITLLYTKHLEFRLGMAILQNRKFGEMNTDTLNFLRTPNDVSTAFEYHRALFLILKKSGFSEQEVEGYVRNVMIPSYKNTEESHLTVAQAEIYRLDIEHALWSVYHGETAQ